MTTKGDNKKTQPNKSQQHKNYYYKDRAYFEPRAQMGNLTGAQQKSLVTLVTDQQN